MVGADRIIIERAFRRLNFSPDRQIRHRQKWWNVIARSWNAKFGDDVTLAEERHQVFCCRLILCPLPNAPEIVAMRHESTQLAPGTWKSPRVGWSSRRIRLGDGPGTGRVPDQGRRACNVGLIVGRVIVGGG